MSEADDIRARWDIPSLRGLWAKAREALEAPKQPPTFRLELPDEETREKVGEVYGRPMWGQGTRISVSKLDDAVRRAAGSGIGLEQVLEIVHGRPVSREGRTGTGQEQRAADPVVSALAQRGLDDRAWARPWSEWWHKYGRVAEDELRALAEHAAAVLAGLSLDPGHDRGVWTSRTELADRATGNPYALDSGTALSRVVLRAAAFAHGVEPAGNERERRRLWELCGVAPEAASDTVLCWSLPCDGTDAWSAGIGARTELGLPVHLTHLDLDAAPQRLVRPGTAVAVCESPRVLEAAAREGLGQPLLCVSGPVSTVAVRLLDRLRADGATLHHHGNFDWSGLSVAHTVLGRGAVPWRMSAAEYRRALDRAFAHRTDLPTLVGEPAESPWDPQLTELMAATGRAIPEEIVLGDLLEDLRTGLA